MLNERIGEWVILIGLGLIVLGIIIYFFHDALSWIGRLPGDIHIEREGFSLYIPITTMILFSLAGTILLWIIQWLSK